MHFREPPVASVSTAAAATAASVGQQGASGFAKARGFLDLTVDAFLTRLLPGSEAGAVSGNKNRLPPILGRSNGGVEKLRIRVLVEGFGFQEQSAALQCEHLSLLLINKASQIEADPLSRDPAAGTLVSGLDALHTRLLGNYIRWYSSLSGQAPLLAGRNAWDQQIVETILFLLVWGESANLRHMPECLSFIFHCVLSEARELFSSPAAVASGMAAFQIPQQRRFLDDVVAPLYRRIKMDMSKKKANSDKLKSHKSRRNYDDWNEVFWNPRCLLYNLRTIPALLDEGSDQPSALGKSYVEHRSWLHPLKSFWRIFQVHVVAFHALTACAFLATRYDTPPVRIGNMPLPLSTVALTHASLALMHDVLEYSFRVGSLRSKFPIGGLRHYAFKRRFFAFLRAAALIVLVVSLVFSLDNVVPPTLRLSVASFGKIALVYGAIQCVMFVPQFLDAESGWGLKSVGQPFAGQSVLKYAKPSAKEILTYTLFWILIGAAKIISNYYYLFLPMCGPSRDLYNRTVSAASIVTYEGAFSGAYLALGWLSVLAMFFVDGQLWFSVFCSIFGFADGVIKGMKRWRFVDAITKLPLLLVGKWNSDRKMHADFVRSTALFKEKCSAPIDASATFAGVAQSLIKHGSRADIPSRGTQTMPVRSFDEREEKDRSTRWEEYGSLATAWNGVIEELYMNDLISSNEAKNLCFWCPNSCAPKGTSSTIRRLLSSNTTGMRQYFSIATTNRNYFFLPIFLLSGSDRTPPFWRLCRSGPTKTHLAASRDFSRAVSFFLQSTLLAAMPGSNFHVTVVRPSMFLNGSDDITFSRGFAKRLCRMFDSAEKVIDAESDRDMNDFIAATVHFLNFIPSFWTSSASSLSAHNEVQRLLEALHDMDAVELRNALTTFWISEEHLVRVMRCAAHPIEAKQNVYVPKNAEAKRRIDWFNSTLRLPMPRAMPVAKMRSLSTLTP